MGYRWGHGVSPPVMEVMSRFPERTRRDRPHKHYYFVGDYIQVTCTALRVPNKKLAWSFLKHGHSSPVIRDLERNNVTHNVENVLDGEACVEQVVSTLRVKATMDMDKAYISCFSYSGSPSSECVGHGDPMEYCLKTYALHIQGGPAKEPELRVRYSKLPSFVTDGEYLTATCTVHTGDGGTLIWVMYTQEGNRTLEYNFDTEIASETGGLDDDGLVFVESTVRFRVGMSFFGSALACFAYDVSEAHSLACLKTDRFCRVTPPIVVLKKPEPEPSWYSFPRPGFFLMLLGSFLILLCLGAPLQLFGENDWDAEADPVADNWQYMDYTEGKEMGILQSIGFE